MTTKTQPVLLSNRLVSNFGDIVNEIFREDTTQPHIAHKPRLEFSENETNYTLRAELPGISKKDISIKLENDLLKIHGLKARNEATGKLYVNEINYGSYERILKVPKDIKQNSIDAELSDGILIITLEKKEKIQPKEIQIK